MKRKVLVLEDEESIRSFLVLNMKRGGYEVIEAETGEQALEKYRENQDLAVAILDVMLPGIDGYEVCRTMRAEGYQAGVIMLTARTQEADKVNGLMNGADDYVTKPFSSIELVARVDALYRRVSGSPFSVFKTASGHSRTPLDHHYSRFTYLFPDDCTHLIGRQAFRLHK